MLDYLKKYGQLSFEAAPLNDVDRLIFAQLSYLNFADLKRGESVNQIEQYVVFEDGGQPSEARFDFQHKDDKALCALLATSARFRDVRLLDFSRSSDIETQGQFAALSLLLPDGALFIAFRGTDNTFAGWKEDFDLAFKDELPAQRTACDYVRRMAAEFEVFELCGHSKGGNLALYSALMCGDMLQRKMRGALSFDGPGLHRALVDSPVFSQLQPRLRVLVPHASLVGMLFEQPSNLRAVRCGVPGLLQHYPYTWRTEGMDFSYAQHVGKSGQLLGQSLCGMLEKLSLETRTRFVEAIYEIFTATGAQTLNELGGALIQNAPAVLRRLREIAPEDFKLLRPVIVAFWQSVAQVLRSMLTEES